MGQIPAEVPTSLLLFPFTWSFSMGPTAKGHGAELQLAYIYGCVTWARSKWVLIKSEFSLSRLRLSLFSLSETTQCFPQNESQYLFESLQCLPCFSPFYASILLLRPSIFCSSTLSPSVLGLLQQPMALDSLHLFWLLLQSSSLDEPMVHFVHSQTKYYLS